MNVLLHRSHCSATKPDGWSGAPGEAAYIRTLCDRIVGACRTIGISVTVVDGDLEDHPEFHADYDAFVAPHYDANVYNGIGGTFWGRASASATPAEDDALGAALFARLQAIPQAPHEHFERLNPNVTDFYGFRLTSAKTPGVLIELGVGAPAAPDFLWLRAYQQDIADAIALGLSTFAGGTDMVSQAAFEAYKAALQKQLDGTYERLDALEKDHTHDQPAVTGGVSK